MSASISDGSVFGMSSRLAILGCLGRSLRPNVSIGQVRIRLNSLCHAELPQGDLFLKGVRGAPTLGFMHVIDEQGRFMLDGLAPGTYTVSAVQFGKSEGNPPFEDGAHGVQTVSVINGKESSALILVKRKGQ